MAEARFAIDGTVLQSLLVLDDDEIARVLTTIETIASDPLGTASHSVKTSRGRTLHVCRSSGFEIVYTFHQPSNRVWILELHPTST